MKFYINRNIVDGPWGGGNNFVKSIYEYLPSFNNEIIENPYKTTPDVVFLQSPKYCNDKKFSINEAIKIKNDHPSTQIILRVNECDDRKGTDGVDLFWLECSKYVDKTFFVSNWMKQYFLDKGWHCSKNYVVYNGVNLNHFSKRSRINNGKINIVTHHWSNNYLKGFDIYDMLDDYVKDSDSYTFTYIGRTMGKFKNTKVIEPKFGLDLGLELSKYNIYVSASRHDPGPNHILESLACKIPTFVHVDGGGCVEFVNDKTKVYNNFDDLIEKINKFSGEIDTKISDWKDCISKVNTFMRE